MKFRWVSRLVVATLLVSSVSFAQRGRWRGGDRLPPDRSEYPTWEVAPAFPNDVFTFVRVQYDSVRGYGRGRGGSSWDNDYPHSEWNFSIRLHQLTSMKVDPNGKVLRLTAPELLDYPFIYMNGVGSMELHEAEVVALRRYLANGGFLMLDDFWGDREWQVVTEQLARAVPNWKPQELPLRHEIFHTVYDLKKKPQVLGIRHWRVGQTFEDHGPGSDTGPNFQGIFDDKGRLAVLLCHNNDLGDGWEREGENIDFFNEYAVKYSYPMGINIITYVMTH
ncbi:DUF4159 domain-containing protein [Planctomycetes bacterium K23_9]|uniref:DUF4159 domain-containing protein n=1 Tax=Stieleria marina TaxID=1930275 RepID=A0A517NWS4_9BACT|nr:hypothetical protein K239x_35690 [Planctomycetes bacterium K23_9]